MGAPCEGTSRLEGALVPRDARRSPASVDRFADRGRLTTFAAPWLLRSAGPDNTSQMTY
jgi:hypothetical protein